MPNVIEIENIEQIRLQEGIDDIDLRKEIRQLRVGDLVKLTLLTGATSFETLMVRITSVQGSAFRGQLTKKPASSGLADLSVGSPLDFSTAHIHSIAKRQPAPAS